MRSKYLFQCVFILAFGATLSAQTHIWTGNGGDNNWFNASNWDAGTIPTSSSDVIIAGNFAVTLAASAVQVTNIGLLDSAELTLENDFTAFEQFRITPNATLLWNEGGFIGGAIVQNNGTIVLSTSEEKHLTGANLENNGLITATNINFVRLYDDTLITNTDTGIFELNGTGNLFRETGNPVFDNAGTVRKIDTGISGASYMIMEMNNTGVIDIGEDQTFLFLSAQANLNNQANGKIQGYGTYDVTANFSNAGRILPGGESAVGELEFVNNFSTSSQSTLVYDLAGTATNDYDVIRVTGFPDIEGNIEVNLMFQPVINDEFIILSANSIGTCNLPNEVQANFGGFTYTFEVFCNNNFVTLTVIDETVLGIESFSSEAISFYALPNPAKETINLVLNTSEGSSIPSEGLTLSILNHLGQEVSVFDVLSEGNIRMERAHLSSGLYFARLILDGKSLADAKLILE